MEKTLTFTGKFKSTWMKYNAYEIKETSKGDRYVVPAEGASFELYDPFENNEDMITDLITLGDQTLSGEIEKEGLEFLVLDFVKKYGLLGLASSSVYNRNILGESMVLLMENNLLKIKEQIMDEETYLSYFIPFADAEDCYMQKLGKHMTLFKAEDSPRFYGKRPLILDLIFSKFYSEKVDWILDFSKKLSTHLTESMVYRGVNLSEGVSIMAGKFRAEKISMHIAVEEKPTIEWDFDSLKTMIEVSHFFLMTQTKNVLRRCEQCKKAFVTSRENEKYCSKPCRNLYNVNKSRNRKKEK